MTTEAMNRKLAEWMGWTEVYENGLYDQLEGLRPGGDKRNKSDWQPIPDYSGSLDAVAEVEAKLKKLEREVYLGRLARLDHGGKCATALQRSEALCRTLGLWEDDV